MPITPSSYHDVVIAGAGPVGLFLAAELRLAGCSVLVIEQAPDPDTAVKHAPFGLRGLSPATLETFDRRGLLAALERRAAAPVAAVASSVPARPGERRSGGHFAGIDLVLDHVDRARWHHRLPDAAVPIAVDLAGIEAVLLARALELGVTIRRGLAVSAVDDAGDHVRVRAGGGEVRAGWLVGCDGGRSVVRKAAGFGFTGTDPEFTGYFAEVTLTEPDRITPGQHDTAAGTLLYAPPGIVRMAVFDGGAHHRAGPITRDHIQAVLRRLSGADVIVSALGLATTWTDRACLASSYRRGRVLLAGDAAHIHSPLGGQGLNLGLGDASNLGWKLARVALGVAAPRLLDSYERERRPVAAQILDWSRAQVAIMRPSPGARALRAVVADLIATRDGATYVAERVWGVGLRYDLGDDHPLVGYSAPDLTLDDGTRLNDHLRDGRPVLLDGGDDAAVRREVAPYRDRVTYLAARADHPLGCGALLVRPDGIVAWASGEARGAAGLASALTRWVSGG